MPKELFVFFVFSADCRDPDQRVSALACMEHQTNTLTLDLQTCKHCLRELPRDKDHFGHTPSGGFRRKCRKCIREDVKRHNRNNPDQVRRRTELRRIRAGGHVPDKSSIKRSLWGSQAGCCLYCRKKITDPSEAHLDHFMPVARGGTNSESNLVLSCSKCNQEKHAKTPEEYQRWLQTRGFPVLFALKTA